MSKKSVAIASVLKPVKDPRAFHRLGISLRETNKYRINIIGFSTKSELFEGDIHFHGLYSKKRTHPARLLVSWTFLGKIWKIKPAILIVSTFELLPMAILAKWLLRYKLIYDVQENYPLNISQNKTLGFLARWMASATIKVIESGSRPFIDHFFLAETSYLDELPLFRPATVLENKYCGSPLTLKPFRFLQEQALRFLISGTITEVYGILNAIQWFRQLKKLKPNSELHVIGHCPMEAFRKKLNLELPLEGLILDVSSSPVPYDQILAAYQEADIVLMPYFQIESIRHKIPSKLYEALALGKVCLFSPNPKWEEIVGSYSGGIALDFEDHSAIPKVLSSLVTQEFFTKNPDEKLTWLSQEKEFLDTMASL